MATGKHIGDEFMRSPICSGITVAVRPTLFYVGFNLVNIVSQIHLTSLSQTKGGFGNVPLFVVQTKENANK